MTEEYHTFDSVGTAVAVALHMIANGDLSSTFVVIPEGGRYAIEVICPETGETLRRV